jgi:hypothetical protein
MYQQPRVQWKKQNSSDDKMVLKGGGEVYGYYHVIWLPGDVGCIKVGKTKWKWQAV